jgi:hypothetical protein
MRPLEGITVVALEHAIAAPFCSRQLADQGLVRGALDGLISRRYRLPWPQAWYKKRFCDRKSLTESIRKGVP